MVDVFHNLDRNTAKGMESLGQRCSVQRVFPTFIQNNKQTGTIWVHCRQQQDDRR